MKLQIDFKPILLTMLLTLAPTLGFAAGGSDNGSGTSNGGGGFQYPNSRALLKKVSGDLSAEILKMDAKAFAKLSPDFSQDEVARIVREVKYRADLNKLRTNADGEEEGLMFDYSSSYCEQEGCANPKKAIIAKQPFFDTYRALPMKQLAEKKFDDSTYKLTEKDIRQRLLHEVGHLLKIGIREDGKDDANGDVFADRFLHTRNLEYVRCDSLKWEVLPMRKGSLLWTGLLLHRPSGKLAILHDAFQTESYTVDKDNQLIEVSPPDVNIPSKYYTEALNQMEKNIPKIRVDGLFLASPFAENSYGVQQPADYNADEKQITWVGKEYEVLDFVHAARHLNIDLEKGTGTLDDPSPIAAEKGWKRGEIAMIHFQLKCRAITEQIEIQDLLTAR